MISTNHIIIPFSASFARFTSIGLLSRFLFFYLDLVFVLILGLEFWSPLIVSRILLSLKCSFYRSLDSLAIDDSCLISNDFSETLDFISDSGAAYFSAFLSFYLNFLSLFFSLFSFRMPSLPDSFCCFFPTKSCLPPSANYFPSMLSLAASDAATS